LIPEGLPADTVSASLSFFFLNKTFITKNPFQNCAVCQWDPNKLVKKMLKVIAKNFTYIFACI